MNKVETQINVKQGLTLKDLRQAVCDTQDLKDDVPILFLSESGCECTMKACIGDADSIIFYDF